MPTYTHNDYYGYINKIQERAISNPEGFGSESPDASEARQGLYNKGASSIVDDIYKNTPDEMKMRIPAKMLSAGVRENRIVDRQVERTNAAAKDVATSAVMVAGLPTMISGAVVAPIATGLGLLGGSLGGYGGSMIGSRIGNNIYSRGTTTDGIGATISTNGQKGVELGGLVGGSIGGTLGGIYGKGIQDAIPVFKNTKNYYISRGTTNKTANKLALANTIGELPIHNRLVNSKLGKIGTYYLLRANGGDASGTGANLLGFIKMFQNDGEGGITNSNLKDNYKLGLFRDDPFLSKIFKLNKVKYPKINTPEAIKANEEIGGLINRSIPENVPGKPAVNNVGADIFELTINPEQVTVYRQRPTYHTRKFKTGGIPVGSSKSISRSHAPFLLETNADLGGHGEKGLFNEPIQVYDGNHFTPLDYSKKGDESGFFQVYGLTGLNRMGKPFAFYGRTNKPTSFYLRNKATANINISPYTNELKQGGKIKSIFKAQNGTFKDFGDSLPTNQKDSTDFNVRRYGELGGKPKTFNEALEKGAYKLENDGMYHAFSGAGNENGEYEFTKSPQHPTVKYELDGFNSDDAKDFRSKYQLDSTSIPGKYKPINPQQ